MKIMELDISRLKTVAKNYKNKILVILGGFILIGIVAGFIEMFENSNNESNAPYSFSKIALEEIDDSDGGYLQRAIFALKRKRTELTTATSYYSLLDISQTSKKELMQINDKLDELKFSDLRDRLYDSPSAKDGDMALELDYLKERKENLEKSVQQNQEKIDFKKKSVLSQQLKDKEIKQLENKIYYTEKELQEIDISINKLATVSAGEASRNYDEERAMSFELADELNAIIDEYNSLIKKFAKTENYDLIMNEYIFDNKAEQLKLDQPLDDSDIFINKKQSALAYALSIEGLNSNFEEFLSIVLFCLFTGIAVAFAYIIIKSSDPVNEEG